MYLCLRIELYKYIISVNIIFLCFLDIIIIFMDYFKSIDIK